jgi:hypothetical protein
MTTKPIHNWFRGAIGLRPIVDSDPWHHPTHMLLTDDSAMGYAFDRLSLPFHGPWAYGDINQRDWQTYQPLTYVLPNGPTQGLGGVIMGTPQVTALLLSQADATRTMPPRGAIS